MRALLASIVLFAFIGSAHAQPADADQLRTGVWERILARLEVLPDRWDALPAPAVPPSGRLTQHVLDAATEGEHQAALALISRLALAPPEARAQLIAQARQQRALSEVDLWVPWDLADSQRHHDIDEAGLTLEALLELAEQLGRRDVLLRAAGSALSLALFRIPPARLAAPARRWSTLPPGPHGTQGAADVNDAHGNILYRIGRYHEALDAHRRARQLYGAVGDKRGQGNTWEGEAKVLILLGQNENALQAFRQAAGVTSIRLPPSSPNLNAYAERFVRSIKSEYLRSLSFSVRAIYAPRSASTSSTTTTTKSEPSGPGRPAHRAARQPQPARTDRMPGTPGRASALLRSRGGLNRPDRVFAHNGVAAPGNAAAR